MSNTIRRLVHNMDDHNTVSIYTMDDRTLVHCDVRHIPYHLLDVEYHTHHYDDDFLRIVVPGKFVDYEDAFIHPDYDDDPDRLRHELEVLKADRWDESCEMRDEIIKLRRNADDFERLYGDESRRLLNVTVEEDDAMGVMRMYLRRLYRGDEVDVRHAFEDVAAALGYDEDSLSID